MHKLMVLNPGPADPGHFRDYSVGVRGCRFGPPVAAGP